MKRGWVRSNFVPALLLLMMGLSISGCGIPTPKTPAPSFSTIKITRETITSDSYMTGKVEAIESANIISKIPGKVAAVNCDMGTTVSKGQVLVTLDSSDLAVSVKAAEVNVDNARVVLDLASQNYERGRALYDSQAISVADYNNNFEGPYLKAKTGLDAAEAVLEKAQIAYNDSFIKAPFSGVVIAKNVNPGELAITSVPVVSMINLDRVVIKGTVNENQINLLQADQKVEVTVDAASDQDLMGVVTQISPAAEASSKQYPVKVQIKNPDHLLKPGMFGKVKLPESQVEAFTVPEAAILKAEKEPAVYIVEDGKAVKRLVKVGPVQGGKVQVLSGLVEGDTVIVSDTELVKDGQKI
ncbi:MAG: efflux RND transporter periplasmic adaptor subunit [Chitinophagales bacterium]